MKVGGGCMQQTQTIYGKQIDSYTMYPERC